MHKAECLTKFPLSNAHCCTLNNRMSYRWLTQRFLGKVFVACGLISPLLGHFPFFFFCEWADVKSFSHVRDTQGQWVMRRKKYYLLFA